MINALLLFDSEDDVQAKDDGVAFDGSSFESSRDGDRLQAQLAKVLDVMRGGQWRTLAAISEVAGAPEASVSARLRDLRKERYGSHTIERRYVVRGLWEYRLGD